MSKNKDNKSHIEKENSVASDVEIPPTKEKANDEVSILNEKIKNLLEEISSKEKTIDDLKSEILTINKDYVNKITEKTNEANNMLRDKINELNIKAIEETNTQKKYAIEKQAAQLIDIVNQFEIALSYTPKDEVIARYQSGFRMFLTMFQNLLNEMNIHEIPINIGDQFDVAFMECIEFVDSDELQDNLVAKVINKGYKLHDRVVKIANVNVVKKKN